VVATPGVLIGRAEERTGLSDLGPDGWQVGLDRLVDAVESEVDDPAAVERIEALLVERLVQRLRIEQWYADHGGEAADPVQGPLVILGLPRTATTALHHLLAVDPQFRYLRAWEVNDPVPPPDAATEHDDPRRPAAPPQADVRHIVTVDGPAEDWPIHALAFDHAELTLPVPAYSAWWRAREHGSLLGYHDRVLRLLQARRPPHRWLLKMPAYVFLLTELAAQHLDACFVWTHRDPAVAIASTCSTVAESRAQRTPTWSPGPTFGHEMLDHWADGMRQSIAARDQLGEHRFLDVAQPELEADAVGTAERIYGTAGLPLDGSVAAAMGDWAEANRRGSRGAHQYTLEEYGLTPAEVTDAFSPYLDRFGDLCAPSG
jgi:hypothetical protein